MNEITGLVVKRPSKGNYKITGELCLTVKHHDRELTVTIIQGRNLAAVDKRGTCNPYIKVHLLPDARLTKKKTTVGHKTVSPFYNQVFKVGSLLS